MRAYFIHRRLCNVCHRNGLWQLWLDRRLLGFFRDRDGLIHCSLDSRFGGDNGLGGRRVHEVKEGHCYRV